MVFEHKCVLAVCVHNHTMIKIHPVVFFKSPWIMTAFSDQAVHRFLAEWCHTGRPHPRLLTNTADLSQTRSEWAVDSRSRGRQEYLLSDWGVLLLDVIINIAVIVYSRHLNLWRHRWLCLFLKGIRPLIYLNAFMFCANHSWSSFTPRISEFTFFL